MRDKVLYVVGIAASVLIGGSTAMMWPEPVHASTSSAMICNNQRCNGAVCQGVFPRLNCDAEGGSCSSPACP